MVMSLEPVETENKIGEKDLGPYIRKDEFDKPPYELKDGMVTVSYTHLDVYKRQFHYLFIASSEIRINTNFVIV